MTAYLLIERFDKAIEIGHGNLGHKNSMIFALLAHAEAIGESVEKARGLLN